MKPPKRLAFPQGTVHTRIHTHTQVPRYRSDVTKKRAKNCEGCPSMLNPFSYETRRACGTHAHMDDFMQRSVLCAIDIGEMLHTHTKPIRRPGQQPTTPTHTHRGIRYVAHSPVRRSQDVRRKMPGVRRDVRRPPRYMQSHHHAYARTGSNASHAYPSTHSSP